MTTTLASPVMPPFERVGAPLVVLPKPQLNNSTWTDVKRANHFSSLLDKFKEQADNKGTHKTGVERLDKCTEVSEVVFSRQGRLF
jgi:hypothetical protein